MALDAFFFGSLLEMLLALLSTILSPTNVFQRGSGLVQPPLMILKKREEGKWRSLKNGR